MIMNRYAKSFQDLLFIPFLYVNYTGQEFGHFSLYIQYIKRKMNRFSFITFFYTFFLKRSTDNDLPGPDLLHHAGDLDAVCLAPHPGDRRWPGQLLRVCDAGVPEPGRQRDHLSGFAGRWRRRWRPVAGGQGGELLHDGHVPAGARPAHGTACSSQNKRYSNLRISSHM